MSMRSLVFDDHICNIYIKYHLGQKLSPTFLNTYAHTLVKDCAHAPCITAPSHRGILTLTSSSVACYLSCGVFVLH